MKVKLYWVHKLTQSVGSKGCVFVKCQSLPGYLLSLVPLVIFLQAECITEKRGKKEGTGGKGGDGRERRKSGKGGGMGKKFTPARICSARTQSAYHRVN